MIKSAIPDPLITSVGPGGGSGEPRSAALKVGCAFYEFNIWFSSDEVTQLLENDPGDWNERGSMKCGHCAGASVFWCRSEEDLSILIGPDDEAWSVAFTLSDSCLSDVRAELRQIAPWLAGLSPPAPYIGHVPEHYADTSDHTHT
jgi:hypothetical protein